jgi:Fe-S oxidoreductase
MRETMALCVSCKGCKRECPTGVDMARMKIEFMHQYRKRHAPRLRERLIAWLPRYAPLAARLPWLFNLRDRVPGVAWLSERLGFEPPASFRNGGDFLGRGRRAAPMTGRWCYGSTRSTPGCSRTRVPHFPCYRPRATAHRRGRAMAGPLCCGRTFLGAGLARQAREEVQRLVDVLTPFAVRGVSIIGLEPSCLLSLRDEIPAMIPGEATRAIAGQALLFEEFLAREHATGRLKLALRSLAGQRVLLHGHCHQKAFGLMSAVQQTLRLVPGLEVQTIESGCCGMAGAFGYEAEHRAISMRMGEMDLLPAVRAAPAQTWVVADGTSCRSQIRDGAQRDALHVARVLAAAL